jgi:hypothetical protein
LFNLGWGLFSHPEESEVIVIVPKSFEENLRSQSDGLLRIRWSLMRREWHIEQKVGRMALPPFRVSEADDNMIRARDGYWLVAAVQPGTRMPCRTLIDKRTQQICGETLPVPRFEFGEVSCPRCQAAGRNHRQQAGFFELNDRLLEHLRMIDPARGGYERLNANLKLSLERKAWSEARAIENHSEAVVKDNLNSLFDVAHVGYTGKEAAWLDK